MMINVYEADMSTRDDSQFPLHQSHTEFYVGLGFWTRSFCFWKFGSFNSIQSHSLKTKYCIKHDRKQSLQLEFLKLELSYAYVYKETLIC